MDDIIRAIKVDKTLGQLRSEIDGPSQEKIAFIDESLQTYQTTRQGLYRAKENEIQAIGTEKSKKAAASESSSPESTALYKEQDKKSIHERDFKQIAICDNNWFEMIGITLFGWAGVRKRMVYVNVHPNDFKNEPTCQKVLEIGTKFSPLEKPLVDPKENEKSD